MIIKWNNGVFAVLMVIFDMNLFKYLIILGACTGLCLIAWLFVVFLMNPEQGGWLAALFFYISLWFTLAGGFSIAGVLVRGQVYQDEIAHKLVRDAMRQGSIFAILIIIALILQSGRVLTWWNFIIIVLAAVSAELFFISYKKFNK